MSTNSLKTFSNPLPTLAKSVRRVQLHRSTNDRVDDLYVALMNDPNQGQEFRDWLSAVNDAEAIEGSLAIDNAEAARMIRHAAVGSGDTAVSKLNLKAISLALQVVLRRWGEDRTTRRTTVKGESVPSNGTE